MRAEPFRVAIVDYGVGNLFSIQHACAKVGLEGVISGDRREIETAAAVILPGMGAFGDAMATLRRLDLVGVLRDTAAEGKPLFGVCLGVQLLMSVGYEFGRHEGLGVIPGEVVRLEPGAAGGRRLKIPQVGWNQIRRAGPASWQGTALEGLHDGEFMYFVHSYVVAPEDQSLVLSTTQYGDAEFCSSLASGRIFACQFHPERSGRRGLEIYRNFHRLLQDAHAGPRSVV